MKFKIVFVCFVLVNSRVSSSDWTVEQFEVFEQQVEQLAEQFWPLDGTTLQDSRERHSQGTMLKNFLLP
jgi:hypothetical protein